MDYTPLLLGCALRADGFWNAPLHHENQLDSLLKTPHCDANFAETTATLLELSGYSPGF